MANGAVAQPIQIAFDESGNTGQNLLDAEQPVFVLASTNVPIDAANEVLALAKGQRTGEAKFSKLVKSRSGLAGLVAALNHPSVVDANVRIAVYHKRFMVTTKIVDLLVEEMIHEAGGDLYEGGANLGLANVWHHVMPVFCGPDEFDKLLHRFVRMVREPTGEAVRLFYDQVERMRSVNRNPEFERDLKMLASTRHVAEEIVGRQDRTALDPAIPAFVDLAAQWSAVVSNPFEILHDRSAAMESQRTYLETLTSYSDEGRVFETVHANWRLPILATRMQFVDSTAWPQVQVADLLSGAAATVLQARSEGREDKVAETLRATRFGELDYSPVWPTTAVSPKDLQADKRPGSTALEWMMETSRRGEARRNAPHGT
jgi:hypothetical protein